MTPTAILAAIASILAIGTAILALRSIASAEMDRRRRLSLGLATSGLGLVGLATVLATFTTGRPDPIMLASLAALLGVVAVLVGT